jgi:hypothetical protein
MVGKTERAPTVKSPCYVNTITSPRRRFPLLKYLHIPGSLLGAHIKGSLLGAHIKGSLLGVHIKGSLLGAHIKGSLLGAHIKG